MRSQLAPLLFCMFFTKALAVKCNQCKSTVDFSGSGSCSETVQVDCPDQCVSMTSTVYAFGSTTDVTLMTCGAPEMCETQSINFGSQQVAINAKCCNTDLCNTETLPALKQSANGKMCYACDGNNCTTVVSCRGIEDLCISATVQQDGSITTLKGCASQSACDVAEFSPKQQLVYEEMDCCEGDLCNGAETFTLSFRFLLVPLLSSVLIH